jgi:hypothetical protein
MSSSSPPPLRVVGYRPAPVASSEPATKIREIGGHPHLIQIWSDEQWRSLPDRDRPPKAEPIQAPELGGPIWIEIQPLPPGVRLGFPEA